MKEVTLVNVQERISQLEHDKHDIDGGLSIRGEFELACLLKLRELLKVEPTKVCGHVLPPGFVEWLGDENLSKKPEYNMSTVKVLLRNGTQLTDKVKNFAWQHDGLWDDIIAYKVCE